MTRPQATSPQPPRPACACATGAGERRPPEGGGRGGPAPSDQPSAPDDRSPGYEKQDLAVRALAIFGAGVAITIALVLVALVVLFGFFNAQSASLDQPPSPLFQPGQPPPEPRLQANPSQDMQELNAQEDAMLHRYGWVDKQAGIVRIPIERAMELVIERGLPTRQPSPEPGEQ